MEKDLVLTIDQGTTSTRALVYSFKRMGIVASSQMEFTQHFPQPGWVEHDLKEIWQSVLTVTKKALSEAKQVLKINTADFASYISAIGITNQRETICVWDRNTGEPLHNAIVWQDRRTSDYCNTLREQGLAETITSKTGLPIDPYFSASKINWLIKNSPTVKAALKDNPKNVAFGTIDSYLIYRLSNKRSFVTDITNACRTNLFNIHSLKWDEELLKIFEVKQEYLPEVKPSNHLMGTCDPCWFGSGIPITGVVGDQQAALFGHLGFDAGVMKSTYGTGAFLLINTGEKCIRSKNGLLSTIAYQLSGESPRYALEGSLFVAGSAIRWLRDQLGIITNYDELAQLLESTGDDNSAEGNVIGNQGVFLVPSFSGLGTPHWNAEARGAIFGMSLKSGRKEIVRATMESLAYETNDLVQALKSDGITPTVLKVDGGVVANNWFLAFMAGLLKRNIERPANLEVTALGATFMAAYGVGMVQSLSDFKNSIGKRKIFRSRNPLSRTIDYKTNKRKWKQAIKAVQLFAKVK